MLTTSVCSRVLKTTCPVETIFPAEGEGRDVLSLLRLIFHCAGQLLLETGESHALRNYVWTARSGVPGAELTRRLCVGMYDDDCIQSPLALAPRIRFRITAGSDMIVKA